MPEVLSTFRLSAGVATPDFSLPDADGRLVSRTEALGPQGLLVVFACNHCPFVIHVADALGSLASEIKAMGIHTVAINSNDVVRYPQDDVAHMKSFATQHSWEFPYLIDESQEIAKAYGAACTPDFFLLDGEGRLFYSGQFDYSRPSGAVAAHGGDIREAVRRMLCGEEALARPYPSSGCNIKWKPGNEPEWWGTGD